MSPEQNPIKTCCFRSSDENASVARIRSTATVLISTNSEVADISSRGLQQKKTDNLPTREAAGCLCVKIRIMTWQKSGSLPLFFLEQNIGWYKALPVSDLKVWQLSTRLFESPSGSRIHIVVKTKKCSVNKNHNFLLFTMIKSGGFSKIPINLFFKPSFSTGWSLF